MVGRLFPSYVGPRRVFFPAVTQNVSHGKCQQWSGRSLEKLGSWIKIGEMEKKDTTIDEAVPYQQRKREALLSSEVIFIMFL